MEINPELYKECLRYNALEKIRNYKINGIPYREICNILARLIISEKTFDKYSCLVDPILPFQTNSFEEKFKEELKEQRDKSFKRWGKIHSEYLQSDCDIESYIQDIRNIIKTCIQEIDKEGYHALYTIVEKGLTIYCKIELWSCQLKISDVSTYISVEMYKYLLACLLPNYISMKDIYILTLILRYKALNGETLQWALIRDSISSLTNRDVNNDNTLELFASPLNHNFPIYYSLFPDTDYPFGSQGIYQPQQLSCFLQKNTKITNIVANPPYIESIINCMIDDIVNTLYGDKLFIITLPKWEDMESLKLLRENSYLIKEKSLGDMRNANNGEIIPGRFHHSIVFVLYKTV